MQKIFFPVILFALTLASSLLAKEGTYAKTEDGQSVILYSNGTWAFKLAPSEKDKKMSELTQEADEDIRWFKGQKGIYKLAYNAALWKKKPSANNDAQIELKYKGGSGSAMIIFDRTPVTLDRLRKQAIKIQKSVASKVEIISEEKKQISGYKAMQLKINSSIENVPFSYLNYYVTGDWGTIQFVTYTATTLMPDYEEDFLELLDGLSLKK
jgi:hypothetical protein